MKILNKPKCFNHKNCGNEAITIVNRMWLCGTCLIKIQDKVREAKQKLLLEGGLLD